MAKHFDITGKTYARLTVISRDPAVKSKWICVCVCGNTTSVRSDHLQRGATRSCGCLREEAGTKHGMSKTSIYHCWQNIKERCFNPANAAFQNYGERGITMCPGWENSFEAFYRDMGDIPAPGMTIERVNNDLGYCKTNCSWVTRAAQVRNRRNSRLHTINGETLCMKDWCQRIGVSYRTACDRVKRGASVGKALGLE